MRDSGSATMIKMPAAENGNQMIPKKANVTAMPQRSP